jgi:hypothetical protein
MTRLITFVLPCFDNALYPTIHEFTSVMLFWMSIRSNVLPLVSLRMGAIPLLKEHCSFKLYCGLSIIRNKSGKDFEYF